MILSSTRASATGLPPLQFPNLVPRSLVNYIYPTTAKVIHDQSRLYLQLFNNNRVPLRTDIPTKDFPLTVEVIQDNNSTISCLFSTSDFSQASGINSKKIAILYKRGHLNLYLECLKEHPQDTEASLDSHLQNKLAENIEHDTQLISREDYCFLQNECLSTVYQTSCSEELAKLRKNNSAVKYIVTSIMTPSGRRYKIEFRNNYNIHLRLKKNVRDGSANLLSLHVDVISSVLIAKNKFSIGQSLVADPRRKYSKQYFCEVAGIASRLNHIPGVIAYLKPPEFSADGKKGYLFTEYFPEGDFFDKVNENVLPRRDIFRLLRDLCLIVGKIHKAGIIHRDIKPENMLLKKINGIWQITLGDLEFAEEINKGLRVAKKGTMDFLAPEIICLLNKQIPEGYFGPSIDIYAIGIVTYIALFKHFTFWHNLVESKSYEAALSMMKAVGKDINVQLLDERTQKVLLGLLAFDMTQRISLEDAAVLFDDLYRNPP